MYPHHPLWLLPLIVAGTGAQKQSRNQKDYQYSDYDYDYDISKTDYINDRDYTQNPHQMNGDSPPTPARNKLLIIVLGG